MEALEATSMAAEVDPDLISKIGARQDGAQSPSAAASTAARALAPAAPRGRHRVDDPRKADAD